MAAARARGGQRPKSLGFASTPIRTASQKMAASEGKKTGASWFGAAAMGDPANVRTSDAIMSTPTRTTQIQSQESTERPDSRESSINFSYPARLRVASPTPASPTSMGGESLQSPAPEIQPQQPKPKRRSSTMSPQRGGSVRSSRPSSISSDQALVYDPNSRRMVPRTDLMALEQQVQVAPEKRSKKKKSALNRAGSHLAKGTVARSHGTALDHGVHNEAAMAAAASLRSHRAEERQQQHLQQEPEEEYDQPALEVVAEPQRQKTMERELESEPELEPEPAPQSQTRKTEISMSPASNAPEVLADLHDGGLQRRPSVVREEEEDLVSDIELEAPVSMPPSNTSAALDAVPVRHSVYAHGVPSPPQSENTDDQAHAELAATPIGPSEPMAIAQEKPESREAQNLRRDSRTHSNSPVRSARFGPVQDSLIVKHEPPARSLSPRKSALKRSPSRGTSPAGDRSDASGVGTPTQAPPAQRKKSVRVSFDDENTVVVGESAGRSETESPVPPSPQQVTSKKPWYSTLGIGRKKDAVPLEEDEVMQPRPALPSFGSIRGRKQSPRPAEERPLVRPHEPSSLELERDTGTEGLGLSSDQSLGAIIQEQGPKTGANISKVREPLPPVVTSIEGSGYASDTASSDDDAALLADTPRLDAEDSHVSQASTLVPEQARSLNGSAAAVASGEGTAVEVKDFGAPEHEAVPAISITEPSPRPEQSGQERASYLHFPGEFPETETETDGENMPARQATFEPIVQNEDDVATLHTPSTVLATQLAAQEPTDDSDGSSIYSDAYEDLSEVEGGGFQSLDAVVDSPVVTTPPRHVLEKAQAHRAEVVTPTPQSRDAEDTPTATPQGTLVATEPIDRWASAKAYWRSLTAEKRAQLEREAAEEAGIEADLEEAIPEEKKPRRKKSVEQRNMEKKVIEEQRATVDPSRAYMIKPGTKAENYGSTTKNTSRGQQQQQQPANAKTEGGMRLRKTMRAADAQPVETGTRMRRSMRTEAPEQGAAQQRPMSHQPLGNTTKVTGGRHSRAMSEGGPAADQGPSSILQPSLRRRGSGSSTSSFKRARPMSSGLGFRKTMRTGTGSVDLQEPREQTSSRFSLRGMSPAGRGASPPVSMGSRMRTTLRGDPPARRGSEDSGKGYLRFSGSFGRPSDKKGKQRSRFGEDSSDEDEGVSRRFASRFEDSSDEDLAPAEPLPPLGLKTMRGAKGKRVPSPPLAEEEEMSEEEGAVGADDKTPGVTSGVAGDTSLRRSRSGRGADGGRPASRHGGFMSSVLRRNKKNDGGAKISRPELTESAARRDTNLERSAEELTALRSNSVQGQASPRLHKAVASPPKGTRGNWPLGIESTADAKQPQETEAVSNEKEMDVVHDAGDPVVRSPSILGHSKSQPSMNRPAFLSRRTMSMSGTIQTDDLGSDVTAGRKKKKFGALRRMFKLDD